MTQMTTGSGDIDPEEDGAAGGGESQQQQSGSTSSTEGGGGGDLAAEVEKWKTLSRKNEQRARENLAAKKRLEELEAANSTELEKAVKAAREEERTTVARTFGHRVVRSEIRAAAGTKFNDPADAVAYLTPELDSFLLDDGEVDTTAITRAVDKLLKDKPYLAPQQQKPPDFDGGGRSTTGNTNMNDLIRSKANRG